MLFDICNKIERFKESLKNVSEAVNATLSLPTHAHYLHPVGKEKSLKGGSLYRINTPYILYFALGSAEAVQIRSRRICDRLETIFPRCRLTVNAAVATQVIFQRLRNVMQIKKLPYTGSQSVDKAMKPLLYRALIHWLIMHTISP